MKILVGLNNKNISDYLDYTNSFIIGLKDFSINYLEYTEEEIEKLKKDYPNIEIFISINKNIFNDDLEKLEDVLIKLNEIDIKGILFYDLSILYLVKKNNLKLPLIWGQEHMTTNYNTCNYYYNKGCEYVYLSSEITCEEIKEIKDKSKIKLISYIFGYPDVSFSKRKLLTNYFLSHNKENNRKWYLIKSDNQSYYIKESDLGTRILYGKVLNGLKPFDELYDILDYGIINEELINHDVFLECLKVFYELSLSKINLCDALEKTSKLVESNDTVFYYKKTIYKVKDEKKN